MGKKNFSFTFFWHWEDALEFQAAILFWFEIYRSNSLKESWCTDQLTIWKSRKNYTSVKPRNEDPWKQRPLTYEDHTWSGQSFQISRWMKMKTICHLRPHVFGPERWLRFQVSLYHIPLISGSLSGSKQMADSQPLSCLPG